MNQLALSLDPPLARTRDPATSHAAASRARQFVSSHEARILGHMHGREPLTYREIAAVTGMEPVAVARRLKGLERKGCIVRAGERGGMMCWRVA